MIVKDPIYKNEIAEERRVVRQQERERSRQNRDVVIRYDGEWSPAERTCCLMTGVLVFSAFIAFLARFG